MAKLLIEIDDESPCNHCEAMTPLNNYAEIDIATCLSCGKELNGRITVAVRYIRLLTGYVIPARYVRQAARFTILPTRQPVNSARGQIRATFARQRAGFSLNENSLPRVSF